MFEVFVLEYFHFMLLYTSTPLHSEGKCVFFVYFMSIIFVIFDWGCSVQCILLLLKAFTHHRVFYLVMLLCNCVIFVLNVSYLV